METANPKGSVWHRWEPHIHTPTTILANEFSGPNDGWDDYVSRLNQADPPIRALGITDYYSLDGYRKVLQLRDNGLLTKAMLIFPNVELRFNIGTGRNSAINGHLLISPEHENHVEMAERFLNKLTFSAPGQKFNCNRGDMILLGRKHANNQALEETPALREGTNQFKVEFSQLLGELHNDEWASENILLAIAVNSGDGTSGLSQDASFAATRALMERHAQLMFSSYEKQRLFWLGKGAATKEYLQKNYNGLKPCIHGSDAHRNESIGQVYEDRFTWIKGDLTFESLRQICIEPDDRVFVGPRPPSSNIASQTIESIDVKNANWMQPSIVPINPGLVAIIGARGSGKTALADLIAAGAHANANQFEKTSFIERARQYLDDVTVDIAWGPGSTTSARIDQLGYDFDEEPHVQYLSQKFVDTLCSAEDGMSEGLLTEIERVIFNAHPESQRLGMSEFRELLEFRASNARDTRLEGERLLQDLSKIITTERNKRNSIDGLTKRIEEKGKQIEPDKIARQALLKIGQEQRVKDLQQISSNLEVVTKKLDAANRQQQALIALQTAVISARSTSFPSYLSKLKQSHAATNLDEKEWALFKIDFVGDVNKSLTAKREAVNKEIQNLTGLTPISTNITASTTPFISDYSALTTLPFNVLKSEAKRLEFLIGVDTTNAAQYAKLNLKIGKDEAELEKLKRELIDAQGAAKRILDLTQQKKEAYKNVFNSIIDEEQELVKLYEPLMANLSGASGSLKKLSFNVKRSADTVAWAIAGEQLLDLRKQGDLKGVGTLLTAVNNELKSVWETGAAESISQAITDFKNKYEKAILDHALVDRVDQSAFYQWATKVADWLYSTEHISIRYGIQYDGVEIQRLSPGTRGIVLLLLYLAVDNDDSRPLIIDQPEENLDPKSVYQELVPLFSIAKKRRQIIIVTHNANMVVNADADQVIVAQGGTQRPGQLPTIHYHSGGLENPEIRTQVCEILEGGEEAFKERAKRLRMNIKQS